MARKTDTDSIIRIRAVKWMYHLMAIAGVMIFVAWETATLMYTGVVGLDVGLYSVTVLLVGAGVTGSLLYRELEKEALGVP